MKDTFKFNKKRKHYAYIYRIKNGWCYNIILTTQESSIQKKHGKTQLIKNIRLFRHPNPNKQGLIVFIYNHPPYIDFIDSFDFKELKWKWHSNDKRKVKRFKKYKKYKAFIKN